MSPTPHRSTPADAPGADRPAPRPGPAGAVLAALLALAASTLAPGALTAQQPDSTAGDALLQGQLASRGQPELVDRVVAVVGDTTILLSEVREQIYRLRQQGMRLPQDPFAQDSVLRAVVDRLVEDAMVLERAKELGVSVPQEQVRQLADDRFSRMRSRFSSDREMRQAVEQTGQNMFQFREMLRSQAWASLVEQRFRQQLVSQGKLPSASVSEQEIRSFFEQRAEGQTRPGQITFDRVIIAPEPDSAAADTARSIAQQALDEIRAGTDFAVAARRYSEDPGTRADGGDLGWINRSDVVPAFADAAWAAPPGRAVGPIRTRFGYHVIKVENDRGGERRIRHILVRPRIDSADVETAREKARAVADSLREGADPDRLAKEHGLPGEQVRFDEIRLNEISGRFGDAYASAIRSPSEGDVIGPFEVGGSYDLSLFVLLKVRDYVPTGEYRLEDVRSRIRQQLLQQKQWEKYVDRLRDRMYVQLYI